MPKRGVIKLTNRSIKTLPPGQHADKELRGFVLRVYPDGRRRFEARYRSKDGRFRRIPCGTHPPTGPEEARRRAEEVLRAVRAGDDPASGREELKRAATVRVAYARWLDEVGKPTLKPSSLATYEGLWRLHLEPALGDMKIAAVSPDALAKHFTMLRDKIPTGVNRARAVLSVVFEHAVCIGLCSANLVNRIAKVREHGRKRLIVRQERRRLGMVLESAEETLNAHPATVRILWLLIYTAARKMEIVGLSWKEVDLDSKQLYLKDSKTGPRGIPLSKQARNILASWPRQDSPTVFLDWRDTSGKGFTLAQFEKDWRTIREAAGLNDVVVHDLRHCSASIAAGKGFSIKEIGELLGHANSATTDGYLQTELEAVRKVADVLGNEVEQDFGTDAVTEKSHSEVGTK